jgi:hypothetical protein
MVMNSTSEARVASDQFPFRAENFLSDLVFEHYQVGAGLKETLEIAPIYERNSDLFEATSVRERIAEMNSNGGKEARHLANFAIGGFIENAVKKLSESIANAELRATFEWDGKAIQYQAVRSVLVREPDYRRRHDLQDRQLTVTVQQNPARVERLKTQHQIAQDLGFVSYRGMVEKLRGWDLPKLLKQLVPLLTSTEDIFERELSKALSAANVPRNQANTSDVAYISRAPQFDPIFPADRLMPALDKAMNALGLAIDSTPGLSLDTDARPLKSPRAFCAPVRVPSKVYLVIKPIGGQDDYRALFHESGHAEHFSHIDGNLPFAFRYLGDEAVSETFAFLFEHLTQNPRWLVDILRVPLREAENYRRFAVFNKLWLLRRYVGKLRYEIELHDSGPNGMEGVYSDILHETLHVQIPPERYLDDLDDAFYVAGYTRAWIFERQLANFFEEHFGEGWYESRDAGGFLKELWAPGLRDSVDEMAITHIRAEGLDPEALIEQVADF